jgi:hypothetical protein
MLLPKPPRESEWGNFQDRSRQTATQIPQEPSAAPIDPERIHDAAGFKILIAVVALGAALAIAWVAQNKTAQNQAAPTNPETTRTQESVPSQGVTVTSGPQHASRKSIPPKPIQNPAKKPTQ